MPDFVPRKLIVIAVLLGLSACGTYDRGPVSEMKAGTAFTRALKLEYLKFFDEEAADVDWVNAAIFLSKARLAASDADVGPEKLEDHLLPPSSLAGLQSARYWLISALEEGAREKAPYSAGRAQALFDCWVEEQEENHQPDDIARCRNQFEAAMGKVDLAMTPKPVFAAPEPAKVSRPEAPAKPAAKPVAKAKKTAPAPKPDMGPYIVYFDFDKFDIGQAGSGIISQIVRIATMGFFDLHIRAHTDRAGRDEYNRRLAAKRADSVLQAFQSWGIEASRLHISSAGENEPAVPTPDGKREAKNRRAEIKLK